MVRKLTLTPQPEEVTTILAEATNGALPVGSILMGLFGGLALFLYGMEQMSDALKLVAGSGMKKVLAKLTTNRFTGAIAGAFVTAVIQSSSVTTVLLVGFISAGLMTLAQSTGVIMGANVGTTITAQIIAFKVTKYALVLVTTGFSMQFFLKNEKAVHYGRMLMGLGLIFFGMQLMGDGTQPLRTYEPFISMMESMDNPFMGILLGAVFTGLVQSSSATTGIVIVLASHGFITLDAGIALVFGSNVGTCVTAMLASIGKPREAVRVAVVHVLFNLAGVLLWVGFIGELSELVRAFSPKYPGLDAAEQLARETPRQIANAHTVFNVANTLIFIWFVVPFNWLACRIVPDPKQENKPKEQPSHLDELLLQTPALALDIVRMELGHLGTTAVGMVHSSYGKVVSGTEPDLEKLSRSEHNVDRMHADIVSYLSRLSQENLSNHQHKQLQEYLSVANYIDNIANMIETNLVETGRQRVKEDLEISPQTQGLLESFHHEVAWSVERAVRALVENDLAMAAEVMKAKANINRLATEVESHLSKRLAADEPNRLLAFRLESHIMEYFKRMYYFAKRIAKIVCDAESPVKGKRKKEVKKQEANPTKKKKKNKD